MFTLHSVPRRGSNKKQPPSATSPPPSKASTALTAICHLALFLAIQERIVHYASALETEVFPDQVNAIFGGEGADEGVFASLCSLWSEVDDDIDTIYEFLESLILSAQHLLMADRLLAALIMISTQLGVYMEELFTATQHQHQHQQYYQLYQQFQQQQYRRSYQQHQPQQLPLALCKLTVLQKYSPCVHSSDRRLHGDTYEVAIHSGVSAVQMLSTADQPRIRYITTTTLHSTTVAEQRA